MWADGLITLVVDDLALSTMHGAEQYTRDLTDMLYHMATIYIEESQTLPTPIDSQVVLGVANVHMDAVLL